MILLHFARTMQKRKFLTRKLTVPCLITHWSNSITHEIAVCMPID